MLLKARITRVLVPEILKKIPRSKGRRFVALLRVKARIEMQTSTAWMKVSMHSKTVARN